MRAFTPDGQSVVYSAAWDGQPCELYMTRIDGRESRPLGVEHADILSVSSSGELAVLLKSDLLFSTIGLGTLARVPIGGGSPREILDDAMHADWGPNGELATVSFIQADLNCRVEYPAGNVLLQQGNAYALRVSPDGGKLALTYSELASGEVLVVIDLGGSTRTLTRAGRLGTIAWSPSGQEVLFTRMLSSDQTAVCAVGLDGRSREIYRSDGSVSLCDVSRDGRLLLQRRASRLEMRCLGAGCDTERDVSWLDGSLAVALSEDGRTIAFGESRGGGGPRESVYLRNIDGSQPVRLGEGHACDLSPDGRWILSLDMRSPTQDCFDPHQDGRPQTLPTGALRPWTAGFAANERVVFHATGPDGKTHPYVSGLGWTEPRLVTDDSVIDRVACSPDGRFVALSRSDGGGFRYPIDGGKPQLVQGVEGELPIQWSTDADRYACVDPAISRCRFTE